MKSWLPWLLLFLVPSIAIGAEPDRFRDRVAPILQTHCVRCHQGQQARGDLDLTTAEGVIDGDVVVPGQPDESRLIAVVSGTKPTMPRSGERLTAGQVADLRAWIADGAKWPSGTILRYDPLDWWSLRPLVAPAVPALNRPGEPSWGRTPIDAFILRGAPARGLHPPRRPTAGP